MLGDILLEDGGRYPWDAWVVVTTEEIGSSSTILVRRVFGISQMYTFGNRVMRERPIDPKELEAKWRRVAPETIFSEEVSVLEEPNGESTTKREVRALEVVGDGSLVEIIDRDSPSDPWSDVLASEDAGEAISVAEDVASFRLLPLEKWQAWMPEKAPRHRRMWREGHAIGLIGPLGKATLETATLIGSAVIVYLPNRRLYQAERGDDNVGRYRTQEEAFLDLQELLETYRPQ